MPAVAGTRYLAVALLDVAVALLVGCSSELDREGVVSHIRSEGATDDCAERNDASATVASQAAPRECGADIDRHCWLVAPDAGFFERPLTVQAGAFTAAISVVPATALSQGLVGISAGAPASGDDLAISVRFNAQGTIDASNGDAFAAVTPLPYASGTAYRLLFVVDALGRAYSLWVNGRLLAHDFAFRGPPGAVLDRFVTRVSSESGALRTCDFAASEDERLLWLRHSDANASAADSHALAGLAGGELLITSEGSTRHLDAQGNLVEAFPRGGRGLALDGQENRYLFGEFSGAHDGGDGSFTSAGGTDVYVSKYDRSFRHIYTRTLGGAGDDELTAFDVNATGNIVALVGRSVHRFDETGNVAWTRSVTGEPATVAIDGAGRTYVAENTAPSAFRLTAVDPDNRPIWTQMRHAVHGGAATVLALRATLDGGVVVAGALAGELELGAGVLRAAQRGSAETFVAWFDTLGNYRGGTVLDLVPNDGLAVDATGRVTLGGNRATEDAFVLERLTFDGSSIDVVELGGHELLRGVLRGAAAAPNVDRQGGVSWFVTARAESEPSASFLLRLRP